MSFSFRRFVVPGAAMLVAFACADRSTPLPTAPPVAVDIAAARRALLVASSAPITSVPNVPGLINNGTVILGVNPAGALNIEAGLPASVINVGAGYSVPTTVVGLRFMALNQAATENGCHCEGWGIADRRSGEWGGQNRAYDEEQGGIHNTVVESFTSSKATARSTVRVGGRFRVTHDYAPSPVSKSLYAVRVTVENISRDTVSATYRRTIDWDIEPSPQREYVTLYRGAMGNTILRYSDNAFNGANPLRFDSYQILQPARSSSINVNVDHRGPDDLGSLFDVDVGVLPPGASRVIESFYGAFPNEAAALAGIASAGIDTYSYAQPDPVVAKLPLNAVTTFVYGLRPMGAITVPRPQATGGPDGSGGTDAPLCAYVRGVVPNHGIATSLCVKLRQTSDFLTRGKPADAAHHLSLFRLDVALYAPNFITSSNAVLLLARANAWQATW